jgi:carbohydrate-binding DOMON domain-containing protein
MGITVVSAALLVAGLAMSVVAFGQGTDTTPLSEYTSTTPTLTQPTQTAEPTQTETTESLPTQTSEPTSTTSTPAPAPEELAFTGYDPLIAAGLGVALMLGAVALQRRRRSRSQH